MFGPALGNWLDCKVRGSCGLAFCFGTPKRNGQKDSGELSFFVLIGELNGVC